MWRGHAAHIHKAINMLKIMIAMLLCMPLLACVEWVRVKHYGVVNLSDFECEYTESSFVNRACYSDEDEILILLLKRTYYAYCDVPEGVFRELIDSPSKGRYYNAKIKGGYI